MAGVSQADLVTTGLVVPWARQHHGLQAGAHRPRLPDTPGLGQEEHHDTPVSRYEDRMALTLPPRLHAALGTAPDRILAQRYGVSHMFLWVHRQRLGIPAYGQWAHRPRLDAWMQCVTQHPGCTAGHLARLRGVSRQAASKALHTLRAQGRVWATGLGRRGDGRRWYPGEGTHAVPDMAAART